MAKPKDRSPVSSRLTTGLKRAHQVLSKAGLAHALIGGMAANLYRREARATQDIDFAVRASAAEILALIDAFRSAGWTPVVRTPKTETLRLAHDDLPPIDILIAGTPFEQSAIERAKTLDVDDREMLIVTPEDLIVYKLIAGRGHDYEAVGAILNTMPRLDTAYVQGWLEQFDMADRWPRAVAEARMLAES